MDQEVLIGTVGGVNIVDKKNKIRNCEYIPRQFYIGFRSILTNTKNEQWFGTASDGLFKYSNKSVINYNLSNGLTFNSIMCNSLYHYFFQHAHIYFQIRSKQIQI